MQVLHVPYTYYPDPVGGTEVYVAQLIAALHRLNVNGLVVAPGSASETYVYDSITVERLAVPDAVSDLSELYGDGDPRAAAEFGALLDRYAPDIVHLHAFTRIVSLHWIEQAHARGIPVVFTYHTPTVSCLRSGLMRWGTQPCDGYLDADRCTRCRLNSLGLPVPLATLAARAPSPLRKMSRPHSGGVWTALRMRDLVLAQHHALRKFLTLAERIVVLCEWTRRLLLLNELDPRKLAYVPHGLTPVQAPPVPVTHNPVLPNAIRLVSLGRLEPIKGIDLLIHALAQAPNLPVTLDIYGIVQGRQSSAYEQKLRHLIARDPRVRMLPPVANAQIHSILEQYDLLAAPSQWFETGPLVVLEAFAAGIPVLGSNLGGIAEKVDDGVNGLLVPPQDIQAWLAAISRVANDRALLARLRANIKPPRSVETVAREMVEVYAAARAGYRRDAAAELAQAAPA